MRAAAQNLPERQPTYGQRHAGAISPATTSLSYVYANTNLEEPAGVTHPVPENRFCVSCLFFFFCLYTFGFGCWSPGKRELGWMKHGATFGVPLEDTSVRLQQEPFQQPLQLLSVHTE